MVDLALRSTEPEWMDGADVSQAVYTACLTDLAVVNGLTLARPPTLAFLDAAFRRAPADRPLHVLDVGFGAGDMLRAIHRRARQRGRAVRLTGVDLNPRSLAVAKAGTPEEMAIDWRIGDLYAWPEDDPVDLVISSLVAHHMTDGEILRFLAWMEGHARTGWFINDLHRHAVAYHGFRLLSWAMRWHPFVRHDGPLSIARAFRRVDWEALLAEADLGGAARIAWRFPFRYCVTRWM